jgi:indolepyruvate ferredoxin oxidoreductase beta subunit
MGALAKSLDVDRKVWEEAISANMPERFVAVNLKAFDLGFSVG